jgi:hypothetical protein
MHHGPGEIEDIPVRMRTFLPDIGEDRGACNNISILEEPVESSWTNLWG